MDIFCGIVTKSAIPDSNTTTGLNLILWGKVGGLKDSLPKGKMGRLLNANRNGLIGNGPIGLVTTEKKIFFREGECLRRVVIIIKGFPVGWGFMIRLMYQKI